MESGPVITTSVGRRAILFSKLNFYIPRFILSQSSVLNVFSIGHKLKKERRDAGSDSSSSEALLHGSSPEATPIKLVEHRLVGLVGCIKLKTSAYTEVFEFYSPSSFSSSSNSFCFLLIFFGIFTKSSTYILPRL